MTTPDDLTSTRTHAHRVTEVSFIVGNEAAILGVLEGRDREIEALRARVGWEVADKNEYTDRLRDLAADLAPFGCRPTMDAVKVLDYARVAIFDLIRERDEARAALATARDRLSDLYGDPHIAEQSARGAPPETLEVLVERAVTVGRAAMSGRALAIATARLDGARAMWEAAANVVFEHDGLGDTLDGVRAIDPAAVVGSGS